MKKIFLDCGFYVGTVIREYRDWGIIDESWDVYAFEANPELDTKSALEKIDIPVNLSHKAVWIEDGEVKLQVGGSAGGRDDTASIENTTGHTEPKMIKVPSMDFSKFVAELPDDAYIICNMDIEGAEFAVLEKMLKENTINKIKFLDIEFHHRFMLKPTDIDARRLTRKIFDRGVVIRPKVSFT